MWIKWKYNDHGWPGFKELEIPDDLDGCENVIDYLCEHNLGVPVWSERFLVERIEWKPLNLSDLEIKNRKFTKLQAAIAYHKQQLGKLKRELKALS